jgi:hypothetical protein
MPGKTEPIVCGFGLCSEKHTPGTTTLAVRAFWLVADVSGIA